MNLMFYVHVNTFEVEMKTNFSDVNTSEFVENLNFSLCEVMLNIEFAMYTIS